jgi:hypothetical protein
MKPLLRRVLLLLAIVVAGWGGYGCKAPEPENMSARPWNSPRGWETGLPSGLNEGR